MSNRMFFLYLMIMSGSTYLIRAIPFVAIKGKIKNRFVKSFLFYIPYAVLTAMTIPAIFNAPNNKWAALCGLVLAVVVALKEKSLTFVALVACAGVFVCECIM